MRRLWAALIVACLLVAPKAAQQPVRRIVSTSPSITETLFALGLGDRVVAVSEYCRYPAAVERLPKVGPALRPDAERIARFRPDLTIIHQGPGQTARNLRALNLRYIMVESGGLETVFSSIRAIAAAAGEPRRAELLANAVQGRLDAVRRAVAGRQPQRVLMLVGRRPGTLTDLFAVGTGSYLSDLLTIAGGVNVLSDPLLPEYPRISMETVIRLDPDVILDAGDMEDRPNERERRVPATLALWKRQQVRAARADRVHVVTSDAFVIPGPRVTEVVETMARWLHGSGR